MFPVGKSVLFIPINNTQKFITKKTIMGLIKDFKEFIMQGNVMDFAVAVIIAGAFGKIINSLVADIIMPIVGLVMGGRNVNDLFLSLDGSEHGTLKAAQEAGAAVMSWGNFMQTIIDFLIIGFVIFLLVRAYDKATKRQAEVAGPTDVDLLTEIRDSLKK